MENLTFKKQYLGGERTPVIYYAYYKGYCIAHGTTLSHVKNMAKKKIKSLNK